MKATLKKPVFDKGSLKALQHEAKGRMGISFTLKKIEEILIKDVAESTKWLMGDLKGCYNKGTKYFGMDTMPRDVWFSMVGYHYTGREWPCNGDGEIVSRQFFLDLRKGLDKDKIKYS